MAFLVSKLEAAAWLGVAPSTLSNYLRAGKISPSRLAGRGQRAKIDLNGAIQDLRETLDQTGNQALNVRANLRFYRRPSAGSVDPELDGELERILVAEIEREEGMSRPAGDGHCDGLPGGGKRWAT
jgi:hypothetical protein